MPFLVTNFQLVLIKTDQILKHNILKERYKYNDNIKTKVVNGYVEKKKKINKEKLNTIIDDYSIIFDKGIKLENKIEYFIKKKWDKEIPIEKIKEYLYEEK